MINSELFTEEILEAQADLQSAIGQYRLKHGDDDLSDRFYLSLARLHRLLDDLGHPMAQPATHEKLEGKKIPHGTVDNREFIDRNTI